MALVEGIQSHRAEDKVWSIFRRFMLVIHEPHSAKRSLLPSGDTEASAIEWVYTYDLHYMKLMKANVFD